MYRTRIAPSIFTPHMDGANLTTAYFTPLCHGSSDIVDNKDCVAISIIHLLFRRLPTDVANLIVSIVLFAAQCILAFGFRAYVIIKFLKRSEAKLDASTAIAWILRVVLIITTPICSVIRMVFWRQFTHSRVAVFQRGLNSPITAKTSARVSLAASQVVSRDFADITAITEASPYRVPMPIATDVLQNKESGKCQAKQIANARSRKIFRNWFSIEIGHVGLLHRLIRCGEKVEFLPV